MEFAGALRQAVQASGLTLERIRHRLGRRGLTVSVATLSYWQRGRSRPRSRTVVVALEEILQVPPGTLTELLDDPAPTAAPPRGPAGRGGGGAGPGGAGDRARSVRDLWPDPERYAFLVGQLDRSGDHRLERLSIHDVYRLDEVRRSWTLSVRTVVRAAGDDIDRIVCVHQVSGGQVSGGPAPAAPAGLADVRYCRPGRVRAEGGLMAFELVFDRVLSAGDTAVVEYELGPAAEPPSDSYDRRFAHPVHDYVAIIQFDGDRLPARCYGFTAESSQAPRRRLGELWVGTSGSANIAVGSVRRGIVGIEWEWH
ncbi:MULTISPECIES: helix-turn-helix domain-containing protein [Actinomadura]|uniref:helix-turn-helix domain-containing protein n=1 Tax=Actinomadura TaxID=1988 RepID=UPI00262EDB61|nr:helix-turn-helix transcriptional regulator [Actinomadura geliboluensis]